MKDYERRDHLKNYEGNVIKERIGRLASELEEMGFKRDAKTLIQIAQDIEIWQHK